MIATHHTVIFLNDDEYDVRIEAEIIDPGTPEHYNYDPNQYDPGSGAEVGEPTYIVEFSYISPRAHDVVLPQRAVDHYWSASSQDSHRAELRADAEEWHLLEAQTKAENVNHRPRPQGGRNDRHDQKRLG